MFTRGNGLNTRLSARREGHRNVMMSKTKPTGLLLALQALAAGQAAQTHAWTVDPNLQVISATSRVGMNADCALSTYLANMPDHGALISAHRKCLSGETVQRTVSFGGTEFAIELTPLYGSENGAVLGCVGTAVNTTHAHQAAYQARQDRRFRFALVSLWDEIMKQTPGTEVYRRTMKLAAETVPGAKTAILWMRKPNGMFSPIATSGFNQVAFAEIEFAELDIMRWSKKERTVKDFATYGPANPEMMAKLRKVGDLERITATLSIPIYVQGSVRAFLSFQDYKRGAVFSEDAEDMARVFAHQLGNLIEYAELERTLRSQQKQLLEHVQSYRRLTSFSSEIETISNVDTLITFGLDALLNILEFDAAVFGEVRGTQLVFNRLRGKRTLGLVAGLDRPLELSDSAHGTVVRTGEYLYVEGDEMRVNTTVKATEANMQNLLIFPVKANGQTKYTVAFTTITPRPGPTDEQIQIAQTFIKRLENALERMFHVKQIESTQDATFSILGRALEFRDAETRGHTGRVIAMTRVVADHLNMKAEQRRNFVWGAYLHDIGKLGIPDRVLQKPGPLTPAEFDIIKKHTEFGVEMLDGIDFLPSETLEIIKHHHERWDGTGYPSGLKGEEIPFLARLFSLIDVYDALTHERYYKEAWAHEHAIDQILEQSGSAFDPSLAGLFATIAEMAHQKKQ